jgi:hypothetical protein
MTGGWATFILIDIETRCAEWVEGRYWPFLARVRRPATVITRRRIRALNKTHIDPVAVDLTDVSALDLMRPWSARLTEST